MEVSDVATVIMIVMAPLAINATAAVVITAEAEVFNTSILLVPVAAAVSASTLVVMMVIYTFAYVMAAMASSGDVLGLHTIVGGKGSRRIGGSDSCDSVCLHTNSICLPVSCLRLRISGAQRRPLPIHSWKHVYVGGSSGLRFYFGSNNNRLYLHIGSSNSLWFHVGGGDRDNSLNLHVGAGDSDHCLHFDGWRR